MLLSTGELILLKKILGLKEDAELVGGGRIYVDMDRNLVLDGYSREHGSIPHPAAQAFGELAKPELEQMGIEISGASSKTGENKLGKFWRDLGFKRARLRRSGFTNYD